MVTRELLHGHVTVLELGGIYTGDGAPLLFFYAYSNYIVYWDEGTPLIPETVFINKM
jgi:hypothetical protein